MGAAFLLPAIPIAIPILTIPDDARLPLFRSAYPTSDRPRYVTRYVYADTTLSTHGGSVGQVHITSEERARLQQMADFLERCCNDLDAAGYDVISIAPIVSGRTAYSTANSNYGDNPGHGYSVTDGLIVTGKLRE